ncbi:uncharacterized protein PG998_012611 [Apiospora kogelbergensis]|uniref:uncharacterized protein n=1 Tax=Apiospora kogelbergensis TaxID=1337665 RepID=UPI00312FD203
MDLSKQPQQNPQVYTTVGSIYNPSAAPLQPPTRRGRTVKWPPHHDLAATKSSLSALSLASQTRSPSTTTATRNILHYSPLQQNSERAVSPLTSTSDYLGASDYFARMPVTGPLSTHDAVGDQGDGDPEDDEDDAGDVAETLKSMSVKTLTNLASYPNPQQKHAQKVLSRARPTANTLATLRGARSDPVSVAGLLQSDGASEYQTRPITRPMFDSILSKGPGAPQPLTAGPPGPRRFKSSANELSSGQAMPAFQQPQVHLGNNTTSQVAEQRYSRPWASGRSTPFPQNFGVGSVKAVLKETERRRITDSLAAEQAANETKKCSQMRSEEDIEARRAKAVESWYAGSHMMGKSVAEARLEKNRRDLERTIGIQSGPPQIGRTVYPKLTVEEANRIPASEHSIPLISMAYQTLLDHPNFTNGSKLPRLPTCK